MKTVEIHRTEKRVEGRSTIYQKLLFMILILVVFFQAFLSFPSDDGLRHIGVALRGEAHWEEIYPYSGFSENAGTSPWYGYDLLLSLLFLPARSLGLDPASSAFLAIKLLSFSIALFLFLLTLQRSGIATEIESFRALLAATALILFLLAPLFARATMLRPFIFGTIFLVYSFGAGGWARGLLSSSALLFLYPYLAWFYIIPAAVGHLLRGSRSFGASALIPLSVFLALQPSSFWNLQLALILSGSVRSEMGVQISELRSIADSFYGVTIVAGYLLFYPHLHRGRGSILYGDLLAFCFLPFSALYIRTFTDLLLPILFVTHARALLPTFFSALLELKTGWKTFAENLPAKGAVALFLHKTRAKPQKDEPKREVSLKPVIGLLFVLLIGIGVKANIDQFVQIKKTAELLEAIPRNSVVLSSFNQQYRILFARPDLRVIPSSEAGLPAKSIRKEYVSFFKDGSFKDLVRRTSAAFLIEGKDMYLDPNDCAYLQPISMSAGMRMWEIRSEVREADSIEPENGLKTTIPSKPTGGP